MRNKFLVGSTYYFFAWLSQSKEEFYDVIENEHVNKVVFFGPEEHEVGELFSSKEHFLNIKKILKLKKIKYYFVSSSCEDLSLNSLWDYSKIKNCLFWDEFFFYWVMNFNLKNEIFPFGHSEITKHYTSMNARAHHHRCMFIDLLYHENLFDYGYLSWHNIEQWEYPYKFKYWKPVLMSFDNNWINPLGGFKEILLPPKQEFKTSLFSIISESDDTVLKITEKTVLPIFHKRPFIVQAAPNFHKMLKNKGFQLFDEVFDYSFDEIPNEPQTTSLRRTTAMIKETKKIVNYDPNDLYKILKPKLQHNYLIMMKLIFKQKLDNRIKSIIQEISDITEYGDVYNIKNHQNINKFIRT